MLKRVLPLVLLYIFCAPVAQAQMTLKDIGVQGGKNFIFCADAESFAVNPADFLRITALDKEGAGFGEALSAVGKPALRLASMHRWDWRGESQSAALVSSSLNSRPRNSLGYRYFNAKQYYDFAKANGISTIPMLDARYFYDSDDGTVKNTAGNIEKAAAQYAGRYARFIKEGGYDIDFWEIGNEDYTPVLQYKPELYAKVVKGFIKAVLEVSPDARFCIQINIWDSYQRSWSAAVLSSLKGYESHIDYAAVHYYNPVDFTDRITDETISFLREHGFFKTRLAITEWRHTSLPDEFDRTFKSAAVYSRYALFMLRHIGIEAACVHALPLFGGLAEWSDGSNWTAYSQRLGRIGIPDAQKTPRWRVLPFGLAEKMITDASAGRALAGYSENPGRISAYLFSNARSRSLIIVNESAFEATDSIKLAGGATQLTGTELFSNDPEARPSDTEPQPWSIKPLYIGFQKSSSTGSSAAATARGVAFRVRPYSVVKVDIN